MYSTISTVQHLFREVDVQCSILYIQENLKLFWVFTLQKMHQFSKNSKSFSYIPLYSIQNLTFETPKILTIFEPH